MRRGWVSSAPKITSTMIDEEMLLSPELMMVAVMSTPIPMPAASATPKRSMRDTTAAVRAYSSVSRPSVASFGVPISGACT